MSASANTPLPSHEDYYNRIRSLAGSATSNLSSGEDEHLSRNISIILHNTYCLQSSSSSSRGTTTPSRRTRPAPQPDSLSLIVGQAPNRREWTMAVVELRPDGIEVLIQGDPKRERDEVSRGLLDVVDKMAWQACGAGGRSGDGKRGATE